jgi:hypothetical protein
MPKKLADQAGGSRPENPNAGTGHRPVPSLFHQSFGRAI